MLRGTWRSCGSSLFAAQLVAPQFPSLPRSAQFARWNRMLGYGLARGPKRLSRSVGQHTPWFFSYGSYPLIYSWFL